MGLRSLAAVLALLALLVVLLLWGLFALRPRSSESDTATGAAGPTAAEQPEGDAATAESLALVDAPREAVEAPSGGVAEDAPELPPSELLRVALYGRVLDAETRAPVPGAVISGGPGEARADGAGAYRLEGVGVGREHFLHVSGEGYAGRRERVLLRERVDTKLDFLLERGSELWLDVFDPETGAPLAGASVISRDSLETLGETDANGRFPLRVADGGEQYVEVTAEGRCSFRWSIEVADASILGPARVPLPRPGRIAGVVRDETGAPLSDVMAYATNDELQGTLVSLSEESRAALGLFGYCGHLHPVEGSTTDEAGGFVLEVVPHFAPYLVHGRHREFASRPSEPATVDAPGSEAWVEITLSRGGVVRGVAMENGAPWRGDIQWARTDGPPGGWGRVDDEGRYELSSVEAGEVVVSLHDWRGHTAPRETRLTVVSGGEHEVDFVWETVLLGIEGRVTTEDGSPLEGVGVRAARFGEDGRYQLHSVRTEADGLYRIDVSAAGPYEVSVSGGPVSSSRDGVVAPATGIDFALPALGQLRLRLVDDLTGESVRSIDRGHWSIAWREAGTESFASLSAPIDAAGGVHLELPVGIVDVALHLAESGYAPVTLHALPVREDPAEEPVLVHLSRGLDAFLSFAGPDLAEDAPVPFRGHLVFLLEDAQKDALRGPFPTQGGLSNHRINGINVWIEGPQLMQQLLSFQSGATSLVQGLAPGHYSLRCLPDDFVFEPTSFDVLGPERTDVEVRWRPR